MLPREVHAKAEMKVELKCRARAYLLFREATERMLGKFYIYKKKQKNKKKKAYNMQVVVF